MGRWPTFSVFALGVMLACGGRSARDGGDRSNDHDSGTGGSATGGTAGTAPIPDEEAVACDKNSDCVLAMKECCRCNAYSLDQKVALNRDYSAAYRALLCVGVAPCGGCNYVPMPHHLAACQSGRCTAVDLFETEVTECVTAADCKFRDARCCGCSETSGGTVVAIGVDKDEVYESLSCDPGAACAECAASIPGGPDHQLGCDGHCAILGFVP